MAKWLLLVSTDLSVSTREAEYNQWYDQVHLPDIMVIPGFVRVGRYERVNPDGGPDKFLAAYQVESLDIEKTLDDVWKRVAVLREQGRISDLLVDVSFLVYREISSFSNECPDDKR
jgi:hypothetical protein